MMNAWLQWGRVWINRRLERRVAAYSIMVILSISLIFGAMSLAATLWIIRQQHHADSAQRFDRIVARLDDKVGLFVRHAQDLSENPIVANALLDSRGRNVYLLPFFAHYRFALPEPHGLALCDFEGKLLAQQKWYPIGCLADLPQSRAVIDAEQPQAIFAAIEQRTHLVLFQPVFYPGTGRAEGYIVTALDLEALVAEKNLAGPQAMLTLRSNDDRIQFTVRSGAVASPPAGTGDQSIRVLFTEGPFASAGLTLTLDEPVDGLLIRGLPVFVGYGLGTLALLALALGLSHQLARRVTEPLLTLNRTARQIATEGLTTDLIVSDRIDEIGELTASFNRMIVALRQSHAGLEAQVQARTEELRQALATVKESDEFTHIILDSVISQIAVLDRNGVILEINEPWRRFALASRNESGNMAWHPGIGVNYLEVCQKAVGEWSEDAIVACNGIQAVLAGQQSSFALEYPCHSPHEQRWFVMRVTPLGAMDGGVVIAHTDITERKQVEHLLIVQRDLLLTLEQATCPVAAMQAILDAALRLSGVDSGGIYEVDPNNGNLTLRVHYGLSATYIAAVQTRNGDSATGMVVRAGQPRYSFINPLHPELPNHMKTEGLRAYAVIPILHEGEAVACFNLASHQFETIPATTCQALETLALQLGGVLQRLRTQAELEEQRINLSAVFDTLEDFLFILDEQGHILRVNPAVERRLGCPQQDLLGRHVLEVHPPDRREEAGRIVAAMLAGQADFCPVPLLTQSGEQIPVETRVVSGQWSGQPALIGLSRDITARKAAEDALRESEARFHTLVDLLPYGVQENDLTGRITFANPALERLHGNLEGGSVGWCIWDFLADDAEREVLQDYLQFLVREQPPPAPYFTKNSCPDGNIIDVEVNWTYRCNERHELQGFIAVVTDITERKRMQAALREQAIRDPLTGLFNRRYLDETLPRELSRCQRSSEPLAVAMLDLDHFKRFNDAYGHAAGDRVLQAVGDLLHRSLRAGDIACRYGGEELAIVMPGSSRDDARARLEDLRQALMKLRLCIPQGELPAITMSIGVAEAAPGKFNAAELLARADDALYQAKKQGRNQVVVIAG
jgi:diguanylate cyclase (GGDEF)-like protein/PAS domain S-box-containing protein